MKFLGHHFQNEEISLDGNEFIGCTIEDCVLVINGTNGFSLEKNVIRRSRFVFKGPAATTIKLLSTLNGTEFKPLVDAVIDGIRSGTVPVEQEGGA